MNKARVDDPKEVRDLFLQDPSRPPIPDQLWEVIASSGALLRGHFQLMSGEHSANFLRYSQIGWNAEANVFVAKELLKRANSTDLAGDPLTVLCSEAGAIFLGTAVHRLMKGSRLAITRVDEQKRPTKELQLGELGARDKVVVVSDVLTQGVSVSKLIETARSAGSEVAGILSFAVLNSQAASEVARREGVPRISWLLETKNWTVSAGSICRLCEAKAPLLPAFEFA